MKQFIDFYDKFNLCNSINLNKYESLFPVEKLVKLAREPGETREPIQRN